MKSVSSRVVLQSVYTLIACSVLLISCGGGGGSQVLPTELGDNSVAAAGGGAGGNGKPVAVPGAYPAEGSFPLLAYFWDDGSFDPDGEIIKWEWNFGDSAGGDGAWEDHTPTEGDAWHTYDQPGTAVAHLRVTDNDGNKATEKVKITIRRDLNAAPWAAGDATIIEGDAPLTVQYNAEESYDPDGEIVMWEWNFNDGLGWENFTATEGTAEHEYDAIQEHNPRLRVTDDDGASSEVEVLIYVVLFSEKYDPVNGLRIDLGDGSWLYFPPGMLATSATIRVYEGHKYAPWDFYVTEPVRVEIALPNGAGAPEGTEYEYGYDTSFGYTEDYDLTYFNAVKGEEPYAMFGWAGDHGVGELVKYAEYEPTQHLAVMEIAEAKASSSSLLLGLKYKTDDQASKDIHVIFVHGLDPIIDLGAIFGEYKSLHWEKYVPQSEPERILGNVDPTTQDDIAVGWFFYNTIWQPIYGPIGSGKHLSLEIQSKVLASNPDAKLILVGYSMGASVIRAAYDDLAKSGKAASVSGAITLNGVNNGTEWVNYALTGSSLGWFGIPDKPGPRDLRSIYDIKHPLMWSWPPFGFTDNANQALYDIISNPTYKADLWDTDCFIRIGSEREHGFSGFKGWFKDMVTWNGFVFNGISQLRALDGPRTVLAANECFLQPTTAYHALHDGIVSSGSQYAVEFNNLEYYFEYNGPDGVGYWHDFDHIAVTDPKRNDVDDKLQEAIASIVGKLQPPPSDPVISYAGLVDGQWGIYKTDQHGAQHDLVCACSGEATTTKWSPDGSKIAFAEKVGGIFQVHYVDVATGQKYVVTNELVDAGPSAWVGNDTIVYSAELGGEYEILSINISGSPSSRHVLTPHPNGRESRTAWVTADYSKVYYQEWSLGDEGSSSALYVADFPSFENASLVTNIASESERWPCQGPSGDIVFNGQNKIYKLPAGGGGPITLSSGHGHGMPRYSPDGQWIVHYRYTNGIINVWVMDATGGAASQITQCTQALGADWYVPNDNTPPPIGGDGWQHTWGGSSTDWYFDAAADTSGNVYVTGRTYSYGSGQSDALIAKYSADGGLQWKYAWGTTGLDFGYGVTTDSAGNVYFTGAMAASYLFDVVITKLDPSGSLIWKRAWGGSSNDYAEDIRIGPDGNLWVCGPCDSYGPGYVDCLVLVADPGGNFTKAGIYGTGADENARTMDFDSSGNVYVGGYRKNVGQSNGDVLLLKLNSGLNSIWAKSIAVSGLDDVWCLDVDSSGALFIAGETQSSTLGGKNAFAARLSSNGALNWALAYGGSSTDHALSLGIGASGDPILAGYTNSIGAGAYDALRLGINRDTGVLTSIETRGGSSSEAYYGVYIGSDGQPVLCGYAPNASGTATQHSTAGFSASLSGWNPVDYPLSGSSGPLSGPDFYVPSSFHPTNLSGQGAEDTGGGNSDALVVKVDF
jgi:PKD repeat protein